MATPKQVEAWLAQAKADLAASEAEAVGVDECHRRYWLQQSYEKAIKAYALMRWGGSPGEEPELQRAFMLQHSPMTKLNAGASPLSRSLNLLAREVEAFVRGLDAAFLFRIDATTPSTDPAKVSYRYPFVIDGAFVAPAVYTGWDEYQGNAAGARAAVGRLIKAVEKELKLFKRSPK